MAQSQINQPSREELLRLMLAGQEPVTDQSVATKGIAAGEDLATTVLKNKQAQEDRVTTLRDRIENLKRERQYKQSAGPANPKIENEINYLPKESAESLLKLHNQNESDEAKLARARMRGEAPDKIKQLFQLADGTTVGVTYGGQIKPINVPNDGKLNPMTKTLPAEQAEKSGGFEAMSDLLGRIRADVTDPTTGKLTQEGADSIGMFDAPAGKASAYTPAADPAKTAFYQKVQDLKNQIIYLRSGKQINEEEYKRLQASLPSEYRDDSIFLSDLSNFEKTFNDVKQKRAAALKSAGYNVPGTTPPAPFAGNPGIQSGQIDINALGAALGLPKKAGK